MVAGYELSSLRGQLGRSPYEQWLPDGHFRAVRWLRCAWDDRHDLISQIGVGGGELYPHYTGTGARAYAANIMGLGKSFAEGYDSYGNALIAYPEAVVTVFYSTQAPYVTGTGKFVSEGLLPSAEFKTVSGDLYWDASFNEPIDEKDFDRPGKLICGFIYWVTYYNCGFVPGGVVTQIDNCNAAPFASWTLGVVFAAQTLLYKEPAVSRTIKLGTQNTFQVDYRLHFRAAGWNKYWRSSTNTWENLYHKDGGGTPLLLHTPGNFNLLVP